MVVLDESQMIGIVVEDQSVALNDLEWLDEIPKDRLKSLVLSVNRVSEAGSKRLRKFVGLQQRVVYCDDVDVKAIAEGCPDLQRLEVYSLNLRLPVDGPQGDAFSDESFKHMSVLKDLRCVRMRGRDISDDALIQIGKYPKIEAIEIVGTGKITDDGLTALLTAPNLREISIQGSESIGDKGILALKSLKHLELLMIRRKTSAAEDAIHELKAALPKLTVKQLPLDKRGVR
jgi:hypothetical protein